MATVASCPGKVLLAGGYLVLDRAHSGLVVATASRFYTVVRTASGGRRVTVRSPQFEDAVWAYDVSDDAAVTATEETSENIFVALSVSEALRLALSLLGSTAFADKLAHGLDIAVLGDNDFYSQPREAAEARPFNRLGVPIARANKTGLGSSAAMVTSLAAAVVTHLGAPASKDTLHRLAQYVHSRAQGKIGSGFDVSAATYGSHEYTRFDPICLASLLASPPTASQLKVELVDSELWSSHGARTAPFSLPPSTTLILGDVTAGSHTPSMVSKVLAWRKSCPDAAESLWRRIDALKSELAAVFAKLADLAAVDPAAYGLVIHALSSEQASCVRAGNGWPDLAVVGGAPFRTAARHHTAMGEAADVPIEPPEQQRLLDATERCIGVIGSGVPGAGGYDAVWILVLDSDETQVVAPIERLWNEWEEMQVKPLSSKARVHGGRIAQGDGLRFEQMSAVDGLTYAVL